MSHGHIICEKQYNFLLAVYGKTQLHKKINQTLVGRMIENRYNAKRISYNTDNFAFQIIRPIQINNNSQINILRHNKTIQYVIGKIFDDIDNSILNCKVNFLNFKFLNN